MSKTANSICGYKAEYIDGSFKPNTSISSIAANNGTTITVENLFYNMNTRKAALYSESTECALVQDLVTRYAILYSQKCGFILKKIGDNTHLVNTNVSNTILTNINNLFHQNIAPHLIPIKMQNNMLSFQAEGFFSNADLNMKKFQFLLFINYRLVECQPLKKSIKDIYQKYLMKGAHPFVLLILHIDPRNIDVNVHPNKSEVRFLYQSEILDIIVKCIEEKLRVKDKNDIPQFNSQTLLIRPNSDSSKKQILNYIRSRETLEKNPGQERNTSNRASTTPKSISNPNQNQSNRRQYLAPVPRPNNQVRTDATAQRVDQYIQLRNAEPKNRRQFNLQ